MSVTPRVMCATLEVVVVVMAVADPAVVVAATAPDVVCVPVLTTVCDVVKVATGGTET